MVEGVVCLDYNNQVVQARDATIDAEVSDLESLSIELNDMRNNKWINILEKSQKSTSFRTGCAGDIDLEAEEMVEDDDDRNFRCSVYYYIILDCVIEGISSRLNAVRDIHKLFNILLNYKSMTEIELCHHATAFVVRYSVRIIR